jgi:magnesium transporter
MDTRHKPFVALIERYVESDPALAAHAVEAMDEAEALAILEEIPAELSARIVLLLQERQAAALLERVSSSVLNAVIAEIRPEQASSILIHLPLEDRQRLLDQVSAVVRQQIRELLTYPEDSAGRILSTDFLAFHANVRVSDVVQKLRAFAGQRSDYVTYVYVVDEESQLIGVLNMRDLVLASPGTTLHMVMRTDVFSVNGFMDREEVANELSHRRYVSAPVVDNEGRLLGVIKSDQLIEEVQEEATEDVQKMVGAGGDERPFSPVRESVQMRLPWLHVNLITAFLAASVIGLFEDIIAKMTVLAVFLPIVAGQGGNAGAQSLAVVIRGIVMREIPRRKVWRLIAKEAWIGIINGVAIGWPGCGRGTPFLVSSWGWPWWSIWWLPALLVLPYPLCLKRWAEIPHSLQVFC